MAADGRFQSHRARLRMMDGATRAGGTKKTREFPRFVSNAFPVYAGVNSFCRSRCTRKTACGLCSRSKWTNHQRRCVRKCFIHVQLGLRYSSRLQVMVNATSTLLPSVGTLSDFKLSIQAPKTFIVTPTAFSGTVCAPFSLCVRAPLKSKPLLTVARIFVVTRWLLQVLHPGEVNALVHSYRISVDRSAPPSAVAPRLRLRVEISYIAQGQTAQSLHRATPTHLPPKVSKVQPAHTDSASPYLQVLEIMQP